MISTVRFTLSSATAGRAALGSLRERFRVAPERFPEQTETYLDTFDWRVRAAGGTITAGRPDGGEWLLCWSSTDGELRERIRVPRLPAFAEELPPGDFRKRLARLTDIRRLLPVIEIARSGRVVRVLDGMDKTVARVRICEATVSAPGGRRGVVPSRLCVEPVRGYSGEFERVRRFVAERSDLVLDETGELAAALAAIGRSPLDYSSKFSVELDPEMRGDAATKRILTVLLETMRRNEDGLRRDLDPEFLHDFRVAVRRTRSALGQIGGVLPEPVVQQYRKEFSWLGKVTGPTRDFDVHLLEVPGYRAALPEGVQPDLEPLGDYLRRHRDAEQRRLVAALDSDRYARLVRGWKRFLATAPPRRNPPADAARPIFEIAVKRLRAAHGKVMSQGKAAAKSGQAAALHRLRIRCKKLRYLIEFFQGLFDPAQVERPLKALKRLQDNLGDFNDLEVQQATLARFAVEMNREGIGGVPTTLAMGRLVEQKARRQERERRRFAKRFAEFSTEENRERFSAILESDSAEK